MSITVRCSSLPLAMVCPAAVLDGGLRVDPVNEAGNAGSAAHEALRALVEHGAVDWERIGEIAEKHGADAEEVRMLCAQGTKLWRLLKDSLSPATTEVPASATFGDVTLTGNMDVVGQDLAVLDWKTARVDHNYREQMLGYAALMLASDADLSGCRATLAWLRDGEVEHHTLWRKDLQTWADRLVSTLAGYDGRTYNPGPQCAFCPRAHDCPGAHALVRRDVAVLLGVGEASVDLSTLDAESILTAHERAGMIARVADRVKAAIKAEVKARGGAIEAGGARLEIETGTKRELDAELAWPVLASAGFTDPDFAAVLTLGVGKVEKRAAEKAGRGNGAAAVRTLNEQLEAAGAMRRKPTESLERKRSAG